MAMIKISSIDGSQMLAVDNPQNGLKLAIQTIETVQQSEAGTDLITVTRLKKRTLSFQAQCDAKMFYDYYNPYGRFYIGAGLKNVQFPGDPEGEVHLSRVRIKNASWVYDSERTSTYGGVKGCWQVDIEIIEV